MREADRALPSTLTQCGKRACGCHVLTTATGPPLFRGSLRRCHACRTCKSAVLSRSSTPRRRIASCDSVRDALVWRSLSRHADCGFSRSLQTRCSKIGCQGSGPLPITFPPSAATLLPSRAEPSWRYVHCCCNGIAHRELHRSRAGGTVHDGEAAAERAVFPSSTRAARELRLPSAAGVGRGDGWRSRARGGRHVSEGHPDHLEDSVQRLRVVYSPRAAVLSSGAACSHTCVHAQTHHCVHLTNLISGGRRPRSPDKRGC